MELQNMISGKNLTHAVYWCPCGALLTDDQMLGNVIRSFFACATARYKPSQTDRYRAAKLLNMPGFNNSKPVPVHHAMAYIVRFSMILAYGDTEQTLATVYMQVTPSMSE